MASGMSVSTGKNYSCESYRLDPDKLRTHPECSFVRGASFGMIELQYSRDEVIEGISLKIVDGNTGLDKLVTPVDMSKCNL